MGDSSQCKFPVALQWDLGKEGLKQVKNKLLVHFHSKNKSGGGECALQDMDCSQGYIIINFKEESVRDRVLQNQNQELQLPGGKKLKLEVSLPEPETLTGSKAPEGQNKFTESKKKQRQQNPDILTAKKSPEEDVGIIYLESRRKEDGQETIVPAGDSVVATHSAEKDNLTKEEPINKDQTAPLDSADYEVLIENVQENCTIEMLNLLIENISNLTMEKNFNVTMMPEICLAVVTFTSPIDLLTFLESFSCNPRVKSLKLSAKTLEKSKSVRVDNLPPHTIEDYLILYFESPTYGGGQVQEVELIPEENAAIVTFKDQQDTERAKRISEELTFVSGR